MISLLPHPVAHVELEDKHQDIPQMNEVSVRAPGL